jgi:iron-sulfur cluster assembly protein
MSEQQEQTAVKEITITPEAANQLRLIRKENEVPDTFGLRIGIQSGGCCGSSYSLGFDEKAAPTDRVVQCEGVSIFVDEENMPQLSGAILEFVDGPNGKGFKLENPNDQKSCGCGDGGCSDGSCG